MKQNAVHRVVAPMSDTEKLLNKKLLDKVHQAGLDMSASQQQQLQRIAQKGPNMATRNPSLNIPTVPCSNNSLPHLPAHNSSGDIQQKHGDTEGNASNSHTYSVTIAAKDIQNEGTAPQYCPENVPAEIAAVKDAPGGIAAAAGASRLW